MYLILIQMIRFIPHNFSNDPRGIIVVVSQEKIFTRFLVRRVSSKYRATTSNEEDRWMEAGGRPVVSRKTKMSNHYLGRWCWVRPGRDSRFRLSNSCENIDSGFWVEIHDFSINFQACFPFLPKKD